MSLMDSEQQKKRPIRAVRVVTEVNAGRLFDYAVPEEFSLKMREGQRIRVPFGPKVLDAYVVELLDELPRIELDAGDGVDLFGQSTAHFRKLKPILGLDDEIPFLSRPLISLAQWIAEYTCASFQAVLRCMLPAVIRRKVIHTKELFYVTPLEGTFDLTKRQAELLGELRRVQGGWFHLLTKEFHCSPGVIKKLEEKGAVTIEKRAKRRDPLAQHKILPTHPLPLMPEQAAALKQIVSLLDTEGTKKPLLLFGVTGSGKTEVYLQAIAHALEQGKGAIVLVPEIALTPQTVHRFASRFGSRIAVLHSALGDGERYDEWQRIRKGEAVVVVGPRSAIFAPVQHLGLIVVDEEHEPSYKQDETPHYNARDIAVMRAHLESCAVVLGSATPALESWNNVQRGKYEIACLSKRVADRPMPTIHIVDMRLETVRAGHAQLFSEALLEALKIRLENGEQSILFLNRRGYSRSLTCPKCGHVETCPDCDVPYTYHKVDDCLRCHICGEWKHIPAVCPECGDPAFRYVGIGTQRAEIALQKCFPHARILRMDADVTTRKNSHDELLSIFRSGKADILIGTQMIAKGLDFPNVTLVGVLSADTSLYIPDFRAAERTYQLLAQVSGRAGRAELPGEVFIQTYTPDHPAIQAAASDGGFESFAEMELQERKEGLYPPFTHLVCLTFRGESEEHVQLVSDTYSAAFEKILPSYPGMLLSPSAPAPLPKAKGYYRYQIMLRSPSPRSLRDCIAKIVKEKPLSNDVRMVIDMDALNIC